VASNSGECCRPLLKIEKSRIIRRAYGGGRATEVRPDGEQSDYCVRRGNVIGLPQQDLIYCAGKNYDGGHPDRQTQNN
jgi:hypothetical protein